MAYVNVRDWNVDQVTDWLKGLDSAVSHYTTSFLNNGVTGGQLLNLRADDLEHLGVKILGHQEIILEAVEHLRHFHYELDKENLQTLALKLSSAANSLYRELLTVEDDCRPFKSQTLSDVHNIISAIKPLVFWLDRAPFAGDKDYMDCKTQMLQLAFEMATNAHRDIFSEQPVVTIRRICEKLTKMADHIIQDISDPMILQPASLDLATLKKKEQELGFFILPSNHAIHQIADIKFGSPAHSSSKIEEGDEIVQVNYMTVVGWQRKNVMFLLQESPPEIVLTLKKRPRHTKVYGQIYMKPYRLPSKKRGQPYSRWNESLPSPVLLPIPDLRPLRIEKITPVDDPVDSGNEISESYSDTESPPDSIIDSGTRLYPIKPISNLQRRNTFNGGTSTSMLKSFSIEQCREMLKNQAATPTASSNHINNSNFEEDSKCLRDKSASCSVGLELSPRPTTVIGLSSKKSSFKKLKCSKKVNFDDERVELSSSKTLKPPDSNLNEEKSLSLNSLSGVTEANVDFIDEGRELTDRSSMTSGWQKEIVEELIESIKSKPNKLAPPPPPPLPQEELPLKNDEEKNIAEKPQSLKDSVLSEVKVNVHDIIKKLDKQSAQVSNNFSQNKPKVLPRTQVKKISDSFSRNDKKPVVPPRSITTVITTTKLRGRLDKSHSTPAYDTSEEIKPCEGLQKSAEKREKIISDNEEKNITIRKEIETVVEAVKLCESETIKEVEMTSEITRSYEKTEKIKITEVKTIRRSSSREMLNDGCGTIKNDSLTKLEIGIPCVDAPTYSLDSRSNTVSDDDKSALDTSENEKPAYVPIQEQEIVPPKPPPRTFGIVDMNKPAYPADSPKPINLLELTKPSQPSVNTPPRAPPRVFEFPDSKLQNLPHQYMTITENGSFRNDTKFSEEKLGKQFEPKSVSTPVNKAKMDFPDHEPPSYKNSSMLEINKNEKVSPTNSMIRAMIYSKTKPKRKNLIAKRRKVTVNDLSPPDIQGWLYQRLRLKQTQHVSWERRWFVLLGNCLYGYKSKEDPRAACLIFLSGFTVAVASEVKSRSNAFKVYHTGTVFYFSAEDHETLQCWIDLITSATLLADNSKTNDGTLFSETDDSDTEKSRNSEKQNDSLKKFGSLKKFSSKKSSSASQDGSTSLDRKWFFNKSSSQSKNALPVPTAQFRSYRKIRTSETHTESVTTGNFTSHVPFFVPSMEKQHMKNISVPNLSVDPAPTIALTENISKLPMKSKPTNYIHASNPSLCNTHDLIVPQTTTKKSYKPCIDNLAGFVTLEELMIRQTEERKKNPHAAFEDPAPINLNLIKPDVVYGEVPIRPKEKKEKEDKEVKVEQNKVSHKKWNKSDKSSSSNVYYPKNLEESPESSSESSSSCFGKRLGSLKKNQKSNIEYDSKTATYPKTAKGFDKKMNSSLPRMHRLPEKYREDDAGIQYFSDRNLASSKFGERSYEMIYCPETITETVQFAQNRSLGNAENSKKNKIKKQHSFSSSDKKVKSEKSLFFDTPKYHKISDSSTSKIKLKSAMQYTPMSLPLTQDPKSRPKFAFELNLDEKSSKPSGKLKQIFGKQGDQKKEKTFLGSPKLHRAIFKKGNTSNALDSTWPIATQIILQDASYLMSNLPPVASEPALPPPLPAAPHPDYPGLEYPPVFEPETYSLADPQSSLSILRKQGKGNN
ncbi:uncharacterized protein LOC123310821 isoform X2 [Coccinella septempunctata]|uniref:uncharacterized protein LOC123310821 isoform X2 n=1 Tax=Coccinella septempunctata TaxID=41139 RepID=UPI001D082EC0|nr:uncharacterized protein LOC123310821 isoform X2 [Coccinella septempunctata]